MVVPLTLRVIEKYHTQNVKAKHIYKVCENLENNLFYLLTTLNFTNFDISHSPHVWLS